MTAPKTDTTKATTDRGTLIDGWCRYCGEIKIFESPGPRGMRYRCNECRRFASLVRPGEVGNKLNPKGDFEATLSSLGSNQDKNNPATDPQASMETKDRFRLYLSAVGINNQQEAILTVFWRGEITDPTQLRDVLRFFKKEPSQIAGMLKLWFPELNMQECQKMAMNYQPIKTETDNREVDVALTDIDDIDKMLTKTDANEVRQMLLEDKKLELKERLERRRKKDETPTPTANTMMRQLVRPALNKDGTVIMDGKGNPVFETVLEPAINTNPQDAMPAWAYSVVSNLQNLQKQPQTNNEDMWKYMMENQKQQSLNMLEIAKLQIGNKPDAAIASKLEEMGKTIMDTKLEAMKQTNQSEIEKLKIQFGHQQPQPIGGLVEQMKQFKEAAGAFGMVDGSIPKETGGTKEIIETIGGVLGQPAFQGLWTGIGHGIANMTTPKAPMQPQYYEPQQMMPEPQIAPPQQIQPEPVQPLKLQPDKQQ